MQIIVKRVYYSFIRREIKNKHLIFICNYTSIVKYDFRIGVPLLAEYKESFNTDKIEIYGGSGQVNG